MHGAHPGHLAFKLLDRLSLSPCFSPSPLSIPSLVPLPFSLSHILVHLNVHVRPPTYLSLFHPGMPSRLRLRLSHGISPPSRPAQFSDRASESHVSLRNTPHLLIFYSARRHHDKNAHVLPYPSESPVFGEGMTSDLLAAKRVFKNYWDSLILLTIDERVFKSLHANSLFSLYKMRIVILLRDE